MTPKLFSLAMNEISDRYIEEALSYQVRAKSNWGKSLLRFALAACLAIVIGFGTVLAVSAEAREIVFGWIKEQYETFTHYEYYEEGKNDNSDIEISALFVPHRLTEVPPGYTEFACNIDLEIGQQLILYKNEENGKGLVVSAGSGGNVYVEEEGYTILPVDVAGVTGELYLPDDPTKDGCIIWMKDTMFFYISGDLTPEELVYYAERLQPVSAEPAHYRLGYLPEGYTFLTEITNPNNCVVVYTNEAEQMISLHYTLDPNAVEVYVEDNQRHKTVTIHGVKADLQLSDDLLAENSSVVWIENDTLFCLVAFLPEDELIALAESVEEVPLSEMEGEK